LGRALVDYEKANLLFRTHQFGEAGDALAGVRDIFRKFNDGVALASTLNVMSWVARVMPLEGESVDIRFREAHRLAMEALRILREKDWFVAAEIHLTLGILHFVWGNALAESNEDFSRTHYDLAQQYLRGGWERIRGTESPLLHSVYHGIQGNLFLKAQDVESARESFFQELTYATQTKHVRLVRALDLLEDWLVSLELENTQAHGQWFMERWRQGQLTKEQAAVVNAIEWLVAHRRFIPESDVTRRQAQ
jgi:hypothetical protein